MQTDASALSSQPRRGSVLLASVLFGFFLFVVLGTVFTLTSGNYRQSVDNRLLSAALALAEAGAEEAFRSANSYYEASADWVAGGWTAVTTADGNFFTKTLDTSGEALDMEGNHSGRIRIITEAPSGGSDVRIIAYGIILDANGNELQTQVVDIEAEVFKPYQGFIAKDTVTINGHTAVNSIHSGIWGSLATALSNKRGRGLIGSIQEGLGTVDLGQSAVQGSALSGSSDPENDGAVVYSTAPSQGFVGDFDTDFPPVSAPDGSTGWTSGYSVWTTINGAF